MQYSLYTGLEEEAGHQDKDGIFDMADDTKHLVEINTNKKVCSPSDIVYTEVDVGKCDYKSWSKVFPGLLVWAFGMVILF